MSPIRFCLGATAFSVIFASVAGALTIPHGVSRGGGGGPTPMDPQEPDETVLPVSFVGPSLASSVDFFTVNFAHGAETTGIRITDMTLGEHSLVFDGIQIDYVLASDPVPGTSPGGSQVPNFANVTWSRISPSNQYFSGAFTVAPSFGDLEGNMVKFRQNLAGTELVLAPPDVPGRFGDSQFFPINHIDLFVTQIVPDSGGTASLLAFGIALVALLRRRLA